MSLLLHTYAAIANVVTVTGGRECSLVEEGEIPRNAATVTILRAYVSFLHALELIRPCDHSEGKEAE